MSELTLVIGNKNYSSWSLRPWLALRHAGMPFAERMILLFDENWKEAIAAVSPSGRVPVLLQGGCTVWETLVILEDAHELFPEAGLWPEDRDARALARSVSSSKCMPALPLFATACPWSCGARTSRARAVDPGWRKISPEYARSGVSVATATERAATSSSAASARRMPCSPGGQPPGYVRGRTRRHLRRLQPRCPDAACLH